MFNQNVSLGDNNHIAISGGFANVLVSGSHASMSRLPDFIPSRHTRHLRFLFQVQSFMISFANRSVSTLYSEELERQLCQGSV
jgi:hypothetical protein